MSTNQDLVLFVEGASSAQQPSKKSFREINSTTLLSFLSTFAVLSMNLNQQEARHQGNPLMKPVHVNHSRQVAGRRVENRFGGAKRRFFFPMHYTSVSWGYVMRRILSTSQICCGDEFVKTGRILRLMLSTKLLLLSICS